MIVVGEHACAAIAKALERDEHFTTLSLAGNVVRGAGAASVGQLLLTNNTITSLDLRSNDIDTQVCNTHQLLDCSTYYAQIRELQCYSKR